MSVQTSTDTIAHAPADAATLAAFRQVYATILALSPDRADEIDAIYDATWNRQYEIAGTRAHAAAYAAGRLDQSIDDLSVWDVIDKLCGLVGGASDVAIAVLTHDLINPTCHDLLTRWWIDAGLPLPGPDPATVAWDAQLGAPGAPLAGVTLTGRRALPHGIEYALLPSTVDVAAVRAARPAIAAALRCPAYCLVVDEHDEGVRLQLLDDTLLQDATEHPGPDALDAVTGTVAIGVHADGAPATWQLWDGNRAFHGLVVGNAEQVDVLRGLTAAVYGHPTVTCWQVDPFGELGLTTADRTAYDLYEGVTMFNDLAAVIEGRAAELTARAARWQPTEDMPLLLVAVASGGWVLSWQDDTGCSLADILAESIRQAGHVGVSIVLAVDDVELTTFGQHCGLRSQFTQPNTLLLADAAAGGLPAYDSDGEQLHSVGRRLGSPVPLRVYQVDRFDLQPARRYCAQDGIGRSQWLYPPAWIASAVLGTELVDALRGVAQWHPIVVHAVYAALAALCLCMAVRILSAPVHGHCDCCDQCGTAADVPTGRTGRACDEQLREAGWQVAGDVMRCPTCRQ